MQPPKTVFLIEDDKDDQEFFTDALRKIANAVLFDIASNGKEAIERLKNAATLPDLIFTDINMPVMGGIEYLSAIAANPKMNGIPVVILTSSTGQIDLARKLGAKAFIKKPMDGTTLHGQIEQMINLDFVVDHHIATQTFQTALTAF